MKNLKALSIMFLIGTLAISCNTDSKKQAEKADNQTADSTENRAENSNKMPTDHGPGMGTINASGTETGTTDTLTRPGVTGTGTSDTRPVPTGTGTERKKADTGLKQGKWPTQGDPFS